MIPAALWPLIGRAALLGAVMGAGAIVWNFAPVIGPAAVQHRLEAQRDGWKKAADDWKGASAGWEGAYGVSESRRATERHNALTAAQEVASACSTRVEEARRSAGAIRTIIRKVPTYDAQGCPARALVPARELRDALQPRPH